LCSITLQTISIRLDSQLGKIWLLLHKPLCFRAALSMLGYLSLGRLITTLIYMEAIKILGNRQVDLKFGVAIINSKSQDLSTLITVPSAATTNTMLLLQVISSRKQSITIIIRLQQT
jgi:hypothetical protein